MSRVSLIVRNSRDECLLSFIKILLQERGRNGNRLFFSESNFAHLTGVRYAEQVTPKVFFQMC